jgi:hypothetical protein
MNQRPPCKVLVFVLAAALGMGLFTACWAAEGDLRILSSDEHSLILDLTPPSLETEPLPGQEKAYRKLRVQGWASTSLPGRPELPTKAVLIQVPAGGDISVEVLENAWQSVPDRLVAPVPTISLREDGLPRTDYTEDYGVYHSSGFFPETEVEVSTRGILRGVTVARLILYPFRWDPAERELLCSTRMRIKVHFEEPLPAQAAAPFLDAGSGPKAAYEELLQSIIVNYQVRETLLERPGQVAESVSDGQSPTTSLKIDIKQDGIYKLTYEQLKGAGVPILSIDPRTFQLFNRGNEVAIRVVSKLRNHFRPGDVIEFYAQGMDTAVTDTNVYWLSWGHGLGKRATVVSGRVAKGTLLNAFHTKVRQEENLVLWGATPGLPQSDPWFWEEMLAPKTKTCSINLPAPTADSRDALIRVASRGYTTPPPHPDHHTRISLNGSLVGDAKWDGDLEFIQEVPISQTLLTGSDNTITIQIPGDTGAPFDEVLLNWIEVEYWRRFEAVQNELAFTVRADRRGRIRVTNLHLETIGVYDITDPYSMKILTGFKVSTAGAGYNATFEDDMAGGKTYLVLTTDRVKAPAGMELWQTTNLKGIDNQADYLLITPREFLSAAKPLITFRSSQSLAARAVAVEDVFNEFSYGLVDPQAIKDFLSYAYHSWKRPAPTYVLLLGDATFDFRDWLKTGKKSRVPLHFAMTSQIGLTPDDNWYVAVDGDDVLPEMFIGRIPAADAEKAAAVVQKVIRYEQATDYQPRKALFVADNNDMSFESLTETLIKFLPADFDTRRVYLRNYTNFGKATQDILSHLDAGMLLTTYAGHGYMTGWAGEHVIESSDIQSLNNGDKLTFVMTLDCLNGFFAYPQYYSLGEEFVVAPDRGAIASFSPSGLGYVWEHQILGNEVFVSIFTEGFRTLGAVTTRSKINAYAKGATEDLVKTFTLLGDPATRLRMVE